MGVAPACDALSVSRASLYRQRRGPVKQVKRRSHRALSPDEHQAVMDLLHNERFMDKAPPQVWAELLDDGLYFCSLSTMYRILRMHEEVRERRNQLIHPNHPVPRLVATAPNQVWSWDITKLLGPVKWTCYYLYVLLDIYSRYVVGWMVARLESGSLAGRLIEESCRKQAVESGQLTLHADRGPSMISKSVAFMLADLGLTKSHSRPHVSNDNPYSEAQFKTLKYRPAFPDRFGGLEHARSFCYEFFTYYNTEHRHSGLGMLTPESVHYGYAEEILAAREQTLRRAYSTHPERFVQGPPQLPELPSEVWINPPRISDKSQHDPPAFHTPGDTTPNPIPISVREAKMPIPPLREAGGNSLNSHI